jgi:hypothetical protein
MRIAGYFLLLSSFLLTGAKADVISSFQIHVNTSALQGQNGYLDFQFNPGAGSDAASATLSFFGSDGTLVPLTLNSGAVSGTLPGTVTINNDTVYNDYNQGFTFGSFFDIFVTLDIPSFFGTATSGDAFVAGLYDSDDSTPLITTEFDPGLVKIDLDINGNPTVTNYSPDGEANVAQTPEPGSMLLLMSALGLITAVRRRP